MMTDICTALSRIPKLGQALRQAYPSWKILYIEEYWDSEYWVREICHNCDEGPLVYAQTRIPKQTYLTHEVALNNLGSASIGDHFLFLRDDVSRSPFSCKAITEQDSIHTKIATYLGQEPVFYQRESTFSIAKNSLTISEYFGQKALHAFGISAP